MLTRSKVKSITLHRSQEGIQIVLLLVLSVVPQFAQIVEPTLLALLFDFAVDVDHVDLVAGRFARFLRVVGRFAEIKQVQ